MQSLRHGPLIWPVARMSINFEEENMENKKALLANLAHFTGSENFYRHVPRHTLIKRYIYTEGVQYLATYAECYWLLDQIVLNRPAQLGVEDFQVCKLQVASDKTATLTTEDGNDNVLDVRTIDYTDFPLPEITLWVIRNEMDGFTIMLPSEY
jgi:hypothetical protein